jgi:hypothetical protein
MAQLAEAFREAGYVPTDERLLQIAIEVLAAYPNPGSSAAQEALFANIVRSADFLNEVYAPFRSQAMARYLRFALARIEEAAPAPRRKAPGNGSRPVVEMQEAAREMERRKAEARDKERRERERHEQYVGVIAAWMATPAAHYKIDDQPFWYASTRRGHQSLVHDKHEIRFKELLLAGLPEDDHPIGFYRRPDEIAAMWEAAHEAG